MKVCQIMAGDEEGGLEKHFVEMSNGLLDYVDQVVVIGHEKYRQRFLPRVYFISLDLSCSRRNLFMLFHLIKILRQEAPDVIHAQANKAVDILNSIRKFVPGFKVGTVHGKKKNLAMYTGMHTVIGVSKGAVFGFKHPDVRVVYNGIPSSSDNAYSRKTLVERFSLNPALHITLSVGRLVHVKAFDNLINAWQPEFGHLLIVGDGSEKIKLERLIQQRGLTGLVVLGGFCTDVRQMMSAADLLVFSSHREGFSYVLAEALLSRLPVLSTRVPGAEELLPEHFLVKVNDIDELSQSLRRVLANLPETVRLQSYLFDWASQTLTLQNMLSATAAIYRDLLERG